MTPPPRPVRLTASARRNLFLAIVISVAGAALVLVLLGQVQQHARQQSRLIAGDTFVDGKVTRKYSRRDSAKSGDSIIVESTYHAEYEFVAGGHTVRGIARIPKSLWDTLSANGPVGVYYTEGNPSVHQLVRANQAGRQQAARILLYVCGGLVCLFLIGTIDYLNRIRREQRKLRDWTLSPDRTTLVNPHIPSETIALDTIELVELASAPPS